MRRKSEFIHARPGWPDLRWSAEAIAPLQAEVRHEQGRLLGRMESLGFELRSEASLTVMTGEVVTTSAIEGEVLDPREVRSSLSRQLGIDAAGLPRASRDVDGVVEMMLDATRNFRKPLTRARLFEWHAALFPTGRSGLRRIKVGGWRTAASGPMQVVSGPVGRETVHFEAPDAGRLASEMKRFIDWFESDKAQDPVVRAGVAHLWFVTIHPFEDGNGRIARAIAEMALARSDGMPERFYSMSSQIQAERKEYYRQLERAQRGGLDITEWLEWFLACLDRAIEGAETLIGTVLAKARLWQQINRHPVNDRQRAVIERMLGGFEGHLTTSKYATLAKCSTDTALRDITELVERGVLVRNPGAGRSTSYRIGDAANQRSAGSHS